MPIHRVFLDWTEPGLMAGAQWLIARYRTRTALDLAEVSVVLPTDRAGRRLLLLLEAAAKSERLSFVPPQCHSVDDWPKQVITPSSPVADPLARQLAWAGTLQSHSRSLDVFPDLADEGIRSFSWGMALDRLRAELAAEELTFADVARQLARRTRPSAHDAERWNVLAELEARYLERLELAGLTDPHAAQMDAIRRRSCQSAGEWIFLGVVRFTRLQCRVLDQVADRVTVLVVAPEERANGFDGYGQLRIEEWRHSTIAIADGQIQFVETPRDQAELVMRAIAVEPSPSVRHGVCIAIADDELVPYVVQRLRAGGLEYHLSRGHSAGQSAPAQLLLAIGEFVENGRVADLAALLRHPDLEAWLRARNPDLRAGWIDELDRCSAWRPASRISTDWLEDRAQWPALSEAWSEVERLVQPLRAPPASMLQSVEALARILDEVYPERADSLSARTCELAARFFGNLRTVPAELRPPLAPTAVLRLLNQYLASEPLAATAAPMAVEMQEWPLLLLDERRTLVLAGFNEGRVPARDEPDLLLSPRLRHKLGLADADARYARDAYALQAILAARPETVLIAGRRSADGEPLLPSRLLLACDPETRARRILRFVKPPTAFSLVPESDRKSGFVVPRPRPMPRPAPSATLPGLRLEQLRDYLACKFRYYLRHVRKLRPVRTPSEELDGAGFASLIHAVLGELGRSQVKHDTGASVIRDFVSETLDRVTSERFGEAVTPLIAIQIEQARQRLFDFAESHARWVADGWRIALCDVEVGDDSVPFPTSEPLVRLSGRIDRIDVRDGRYLILDYRTSEIEQPPEKTHRRRGEWTDLSLPLARHLARGLGIEASQLGHLVLPKERGRAAVLIAKWSEADLRDADEAARRVITAILNQEFEPDSLAAPPYPDAYSWICQDHQFIADEDEEVEETA